MNAPNEGREEKTPKQFLEDNHAGPDILYRMHAPDGINLSEGERIEQAMRDFSQQENKQLRDQLSKERREKEKLKELHIHQETHLNDQFEKERKMRKELVDSFKELLESDEFLEQFSTTSKEIESLIKKSSSL